MLTGNQLVRPSRILKIYKTKTPALEGNPQQKGTCEKLFTTSPKKPNSAVRKVAKVLLERTESIIEAYIPGEGHQLKSHSVVMIRGGRTPDLPGIKYRLIRGLFDFEGLAFRKNSRSLYGTKRSATPVKK